MDPMFLLIQQVKTNAEQIEACLRCVYDAQFTIEQRTEALRFAWEQTRQTSALLDNLYNQYRRLGLL